MSHGRKRRKLESEVRTSVKAPMSPPRKLTVESGSSTCRLAPISRRYASALDSPPGHVANVAVALAIDGRDAHAEQRRQTDERTAAGDRIQRAGQYAGAEQHE